MRHIKKHGLILFIALAAACGDSMADDPRPDRDTISLQGEDAAADGNAAVRPLTRTDTIGIEGMPEPLELRLFRTGEDFLLPFAAYVPADMAAAEDASRTVHFTAEFGGTRNEDAYVHLYVFPAGTDWQEVIATGRSYTTSRGVPVSQGVEPVADSPPLDVGWAAEAFRFRYQDASGEWYMGRLGLGRHGEMSYMIVRHHPVEYADGFGPRADLILETWRWADGSRLTGRDN